MITKGFFDGVMRLRDGITSRLLRTRIQPNTLTVIGLILNIPVAIMIAKGHFWWAAILFFVASSFDVLDGAVAKTGNRMTPFGGFLDSTLDRISDMILFGGVAAYFFQKTSHLYVFLTLIALAFSLLISYMRARAECLIPKCDVGLAERAERMVVLLMGLLFHSLYAAVWVLVFITLLTVINRIIYTWYATNNRPFPESVGRLLLDFPRGSKPYDVLFVLTAVILIAAAFL